MKILAVFLTIAVITAGVVIFKMSRAKSLVVYNDQEITRYVPPTIEPQVKPDPTPTATPSSKTVQVIRATYDIEDGLSPSRFKVKAGVPVRLEVKALVDGLGCMGSITIPDLTDEVYGFEKDVTNVFEVTPPSPGEYAITCAMGIPHGVIIAE